MIHFFKSYGFGVNEESVEEWVKESNMKILYKKTGGETLNKTRMHYDYMHDQWYVDLAGRKFGLHCGESFELYIGHKAIPCQLELGSKWYVIMEDTRLDLRESDEYKVNI